MKVLINFFKNNKRVIVLLTVLLVLLMSVLTPLVYRFFIKHTERGASASAEIAAAAINKNDLFSLDYDASDLEKESYKALKESLVKTVAANKPVKAAYVLVKDGEDILIASDSETPGSPLYSAPGEVLFGAGEVDLSGAENGKAVVLSPIQNDAGEWVTVVVPVFDTEGNLRAAYCNDYLASQWNDRALLNTIISLALVLMGYAVATTSLIIATLNYRLYHEKNSLLKANEEVNKHRKEIESKIIEINISEQRLSKIFHLVPTMMVMTSHLGDIYDANEAFLNTLDYDKYEIVGRKLKELELFVDESFCEGCTVSPEQRFGNKETVIRKKSGEYLDVLISVDRIFDEQKNELVFSMIDITQRKLAEEEIKRLIKKYRTIVAVSNTGGWEYDVSNCGFYLSNEYFSMLGQVNNNEDFNALSSLQDDWIGLLHPDDRDSAAKNFSDYIEANTDSLYENYFRMQHSDGHWLWILARGRRLRKEDGSLSEIIVGTHIDITEIKNKEEKIKYLNYHDQLTGVFNRRYYEETIGKLINPGNLPLAIIMADVNGLKLTNDAFGHLSGDKLLTRVAEIIESEARPHDIVARIGGDEFVVLMPRANSIDAENTVKRINESIQDFKVDNIVISVSFGWATKKDDDEDFTEVYKRAEYRMYRNKLSERSSKRSQSIRIIFKTLQEKSEQEKLHSERVSYYCSQLAKQMQLSFNEISEVETAGLMHDIGKIGIDEQVLNKTEKFTDSDWRAMKKHSEIGYRILSSANEFNVIADYVLYHHERWDGKGYPRGLKGESIPVASRILSIADSYDAMVSERCYKKALSKEVAAAEIINSAGTQFDPDIAAIFVEKVLKIKVSDLPIE